MTTRYAVYYAPAEDDSLWRAGCNWLGRDPGGGAVGPGPAGIAELTGDPRGYGFHATLKPPMRLREGVSRSDVLDAMTAIAATVPAFALPRLAVTDFHGFLCLRETAASPALQALCDAAVAGLDHLRAVPTEAEFARRRAAGLSPVRDANLRRWGYPDVFATWFFHMTLTRRLRADETRSVRPAAEAWFATPLSTRRDVHDMCLFEQVDDRPFMMTARVRLAAEEPALNSGMSPV